MWFMSIYKLLIKEIDYQSITGIELNNTIYEEIKDIYNDSKIKLLNEDFLSFNTDIKYNLIIGNPPFFVLKKPKDKTKLKNLKKKF